MKDLFNPSRGEIMLRHNFYRQCFIVNLPDQSRQPRPAKTSYPLTKN